MQIPGDHEEPGHQGAVSAVEVEAVVSPDEGVLGQIPGLVGIPGEPVEIPEEASFKGSHDRFIGLTLPRLAPLEQAPFFIPVHQSVPSSPP